MSVVCWVNATPRDLIDGTVHARFSENAGHWSEHRLTGYNHASDKKYLTATGSWTYCQVKKHINVPFGYSPIDQAIMSEMEPDPSDLVLNPVSSEWSFVDLYITRFDPTGVYCRLIMPIIPEGYSRIDTRQVTPQAGDQYWSVRKQKWFTSAGRFKYNSTLNWFWIRKIDTSTMVIGDKAEKSRSVADLNDYEIIQLKNNSWIQVLPMSSEIKDTSEYMQAYLYGHADSAAWAPTKTRTFNHRLAVKLRRPECMQHVKGKDVVVVTDLTKCYSAEMFYEIEGQPQRAVLVRDNTRFVYDTEKLLVLEK